MAVNRRDILAGAAAIPALGLAGGAAAADYALTDAWNPNNWTRPAGLAPDMEIDLFKRTELGGFENSESITQRNDDPNASDRIIERVHRPRLAVFTPKNPNGASVIIAPGGGYRYCVIDKEGYEIARLFAARGVTAYVLFYRIPYKATDANGQEVDVWEEKSDAPLYDAQRAVRVVRRRAVELGLDPNRVIMMGFSAGGHVAASLLTRYHHRVTLKGMDSSIDHEDARPDAGVLIYPVISMDPAIAHIGSRDRLIGPAPSAEDVRTYSPDQNVTADTPPTFLLFAEDDPVVPPENGIRFRAAMKAAGGEIETHLFARGGHGFGLMLTKRNPVAAWPELLWRWMQARGLV